MTTSEGFRPDRRINNSVIMAVGTVCPGPKGIGKSSIPGVLAMSDGRNCLLSTSAIASITSITPLLVGYPVCAVAVGDDVVGAGCRDRSAVGNRVRVVDWLHRPFGCGITGSQPGKCYRSTAHSTTEHGSISRVGR